MYYFVANTQYKAQICIEVQSIMWMAVLRSQCFSDDITVFHFKSLDLYLVSSTKDSKWLMSNTSVGKADVLSSCGSNLMLWCSREREERQWKLVSPFRPHQFNTFHPLATFTALLSVERCYCCFAVNIFSFLGNPFRLCLFPFLFFSCLLFLL